MLLFTLILKNSFPNISGTNNDITFLDIQHNSRASKGRKLEVDHAVETKYSK